MKSRASTVGEPLVNHNRQLHFQFTDGQAVEQKVHRNLGGRSALAGSPRPIRGSGEAADFHSTVYGW